jgi:pimeloyl-ACP methyl ester carboxylesterase
MTWAGSAPDDPAAHPSRRRFLAGAVALPLAACGGGDGMRMDPALSAGAAPEVLPAEALPVEDVRLNFFHAGTGTPVVLIHGASGNARDWTLGALQAMAERFSVTAFDRPGLGRSAAPAAGADSPFVQARLMRRALAQSGTDRAILIGHSYGGTVALAWALDAPESVAGLMVVGAPSQVFPGGVGLSSELLASPLTGPFLSRAAPAFVTDGVIEGAVARVFAPADPPPGYVAHMDRDLLLDPAVLRANARQLITLKDHLRTMVPRYPALAMPVEILHGTEDTTVPLEIHSEPLATQVPNARLTRIAGAGHMPHHSHLPVILEALDRLAA